MGIPFVIPEYIDNGGGLNLKSSPTKIPEDEASLSLNIDYSTDGAFRTRNGSRIQNVDINLIPQQMTDTLRTLQLWDYHRSDGIAVQVIAAGTKIKHNLNTPVAQNNTSTGLAISLSALLPIPDMEFIVTNSEELLVYGNGTDTNLKFDGVKWNNLSYIKCPSTFTLAAVAAGVLPAGTYTYHISFGRLLSGVLVQEGELSSLKTVVVAANQQVNFTNIPTRTDAGDLEVNARVIYRQSTALGFSGQVRRLAIIADGTTTTYTDNDPLEGPILAEFDNEFMRSATSVATIPKTSIFEEYQGRMFYRDEENRTDMYYSKVGTPWNVPQENAIILDGEIRCIRRFYGALVIGTDRSLWVLNGDPDTASPARISSVIGILNNRCAVGESYLYILATNKKFYRLNPTDFTQSEIRMQEPDSIKIEPLLGQVGNSPDGVAMEYYTGPNVSKVYICIPLGTGQNTNNAVIIYNETQSILKQKPTWQLWDNLNASAVKQFNILGEIGIYSGDYNGFLWKLDDTSIYGDGAAINGTATGGTVNSLEQIMTVGIAEFGGVNTLTDINQNMTINVYAGRSLQIVGGTGIGQVRIITQNSATVFTVSVPWTTIPDNTSTYEVGAFIPNALAGMTVRIIGGTGDNQVRTITSNNGSNVFVTPNWSTTPDFTSQYTVGGYIVYHYTNWKAVVESYNVLKQLWYILVNANAQGDYNIELIVQTDFNQVEIPASTIFINLRSLNTIWGAFVWGEAPWGARVVFQDEYRKFSRFRSIRLGFRNKKAAQPFQVNSFSIAPQNKKTFFRSK